MENYKKHRIKSLCDNTLNTKTYEDWSTYLGAKPHRFGVVARLYPQNTINFITDGMRNIFYNDANVGKYQTINSLFFE